MKKHIVCFGDSNTHGYCACTENGDSGRFSEEERWTCLLQKRLGDDFLVLEEGLSGRTGVFDDPLTEGLSGLSMIMPVLNTHEPVDLLIIMLGTNDTKDRFGANAECIAIGMQRLIKKAMNTECWGIQGPKVLFVCPPPIEPGMVKTPIAGCMGETCVEKSRELDARLKPLVLSAGARYMNAAGCEFNSLDFMHLTKKGHAQLAERLYKEIVENIRL